MIKDNIIEYLNKNNYIEIDDKQNQLIDAYLGICNNIDIKKNLDILFNKDYNEFLECLLSYDVKPLYYNLSTEDLDDLFYFSYENFCIEFRNKMLDFLFEYSFDLKYSGIDEDNIDEALKSYNALETLDGLRDHLAWLLAWYYEDEDEIKSLEYFDYAYKNSCKYLIQENYAARCIRFANKFYNKGNYDECINIIKTAIECVDDKKSEDNYLEYINLITYLAEVYNAINYNEKIMIDFVDSGIESCKLAINNMRKRKSRKKYDFYRLSDTDQERAILRLYLIKLSYYLEKKEYINFKAIYDESMNELAESGCTRFYAPLNNIFDEMIEAFSCENSELSFCKGLDEKVKIYFDNNIESLDDLINDKEIILHRYDNNSTLKFIIVDVADCGDLIYFIAKPIYPIIGQGRNLYFVYNDKYITKINQTKYNSDTAHLYFKGVIKI